ncbi:MAG: glycosyltransferase family 2 protein [Patescibacteria group bacterium]
MNPKEAGISFVIPCYNCKKTINDTVKSILDLKLSKFEICMVDDGSKDNTWKMLQNYQKRYPKNVVIGRNAVNKGGAYTRNECIKKSQYSWLFMIDADNYLDKASFFRLVDSVTGEDNVVSFQKIYFFYDIIFIDLVYIKWVFKKEKMEFNDLRRASHHPVVDGNYLFHRSVFDKVGGYDCYPEFGVLDTWSFGYKILLNGYSIKIVEDAFYYHRVVRNSYWLRGVKDFSNSLKSILLKYPYRFSEEEILNIKKSKDTQKTLVTLQNDFESEQVSWFFAALLKIRNIFKNFNEKNN